MEKNRRQRIGIFDSGVGGYSVLVEIFHQMPDLEVFYIADDDFCPYGERSKEEIVSRSKYLTDELIKKEVDLILVACNTATAIAIEDLRKDYQVPFVGIEPYLNIYNRESNKYDLSKMVLITTESIVGSDKFNKLKQKLDPNSLIHHYCSKNLASLIETGFYNGFDRTAIIEELKSIKGKGFTHAILGCTHYPLIEKLIENELSLDCISPSHYVAKRVKDLLDYNQVKRQDIDLNSFWLLSTKKASWERKKLGISEIPDSICPLTVLG